MLREIAARALRNERPDHTLQPTALVHEAYLRLERQGAFGDSPRAQVLALAAIMIRRILVDHARRRIARKRDGRVARIEIVSDAAPGPSGLDLLALEEAMTRLESFDPRKTHIVQLRFFAGLTVEQTAEVLGVSARTVAQEWALAKAWLRRELTHGPAL
jgi:RNA polymerase sigma factor (TIGR02999 family)